MITFSNQSMMEKRALGHRKKSSLANGDVASIPVSGPARWRPGSSNPGGIAPEPVLDVRSGKMVSHVCLRMRARRKKGERHAKAFLVATTPLARIRLRTNGNRVSRLHRAQRGHPHFWFRFAASNRASQEQRASADDRADPCGERTARGYLTSGQAKRRPSQPGTLAGILATRQDASARSCCLPCEPIAWGGARRWIGCADLEGVGSKCPQWRHRSRDGISHLECVSHRDGTHLPADSGDFSLSQQSSPDALDPCDDLASGSVHLLAGCTHLWLQPESRSQLWPGAGFLVLA